MAELDAIKNEEAESAREMEQRVEDLQYEIQKNKNLIKNLE